MNEVFLRPKVDELTFHLYTRPLHPELFETLAYRRIQRDDYTLTVRITPTGHVLTWDCASLHLAEVTAAVDQELPHFGSILRLRFQGEQTDEVKPSSNVSYQMSCQVEILPPEIFLHVQNELLLDGQKRGLIHHFPSQSRLAISPLGWVTVDALKDALTIASFHTFPDEFAIVKTQSLIERLR